MTSYMKKKAAIFVALTLAATGSSVQAATLVGSGDPLLNGSTIITFSEVALGAVNPTISGISFSGASGNTVVQNNSAVPTSPFLGNQIGGGGSGMTVLINFGAGAAAFGLDLFAVNSNTTLEAYDSSNNLLGSTLLASSGSAVNGFVGLGGFATQIASARVVTSDYLGIDNFRFVQSAAAVPEPATWAMLLVGFGFVGGSLRSARRRQKVSVSFA